MSQVLQLVLAALEVLLTAGGTATELHPGARMMDLLTSAVLWNTMIAVDA